jgi:hypothetical protein
LSSSFAQTAILVNRRYLCFPAASRNCAFLNFCATMLHFELHRRHNNDVKCFLS